jgi:hypothetical protein
VYEINVKALGLDGRIRCLPAKASNEQPRVCFFLRRMYVSRGCFGTGLQNEIHPVCDLRATAAAADNRYSATR